ncbi:unnamed protein product [Miscanthus lutarioriparius]|uniref:Uncharacterized protein n=1 Tax=Miscanthus lutarioriparius TaxID=422564 RepID=A0A811P629_9POAL|nr:unnamed protein product [Miscanthus lutarioriparius]
MAASRRSSVQLPVADPAADRDQVRLRQLGYKQELKRGLSVLSNFALSFSIISVFMGVTITYNTGLRYGGPVSMTLGWLLVSALNGCVALSMAEICSAYPTSGGLYYWSAKLAGKDSLDGSTSWDRYAGPIILPPQLVQVIALLDTGGLNGGGYTASKYVVLAIYGAILVTRLNEQPPHPVPRMVRPSRSILEYRRYICSGDHHSSRCDGEGEHGVHLHTDNGMGIHDKAYILALGLLMSQYSLIGYDASAHMTETKNADWSGPMGIVTSVALSSVLGWIYLVALASLMTDIPYLLDPGGYAVAQALYDAFRRRFGSGVGGIACLGIVAVTTFLCGSACVTSNSRMGYAFSRDGAVPFSNIWYKVNKQEVPLNVVWLSVSVPGCSSRDTSGAQARPLCRFQLRLLLLPHLRADGRDDDLQNRAALRWAGVHDAGLAHPGALQRLRGTVHGGDLLRLPDLRRPLLLERQALRRGLSVPCFMGHRMWTGTASVDFSLAQLIQVMVLLGTGGANGGGYMASKYVLLAIYAAILTEETKNADWSGPMGIVASVALASVFGWVYLLALTSAVTDDISYLLNAGGYAVAQALYDAFRRRFGSGAGGIVCLGIVAVAVFICGSTNVTSDSRMAYAFSRDGAGDAVLACLAPGEQARGALQRRLVLRRRRIRHSSSVTGEPGGVPGDGLRGDDGAVHRLRAAHPLPRHDGAGILRPGAVPPRAALQPRRRLGRHRLGGPPHRPLLPAGGVYPVAEANFNYTPVAVGGVLLLSVGAWVLHARFWFHGPVTNVATGHRLGYLRINYLHL